MATRNTLRGATSAAHVYQTNLAVTVTGDQDPGP
jgi:hypothetical protein